jgi:hypothetical protein
MLHKGNCTCGDCTKTLIELVETCLLLSITLLEAEHEKDEETKTKIRTQIAEIELVLYGYEPTSNKNGDAEKASPFYFL